MSKNRLITIEGTTYLVYHEEIKEEKSVYQSNNKTYKYNKYVPTLHMRRTTDGKNFVLQQLGETTFQLVDVDTNEKRRVMKDYSFFQYIIDNTILYTLNRKKILDQMIQTGETSVDYEKVTKEDMKKVFTELKQKIPIEGGKSRRNGKSRKNKKSRKNRA
jgi:hypothetical protein